MKVILLADVAKVGRRHEVKEVADGFARNFIIARGLGLPADQKNLAKLEARKAHARANAAMVGKLLAGALADLGTAPLVIKAKANAEGHLFAQIHPEEIARVLDQEKKLELKPEQLVIALPIKTVGDHKVKIKTPSGEGEFTVEVQAL